MANITEYDNSVNGLTAPEGGETSWLRAALHIRASADESARGIRQGFTEAGQGLKELKDVVDKHTTMTEIAAGASLIANRRNQATLALNDYASKADPTNPHYAQGAMDQIVGPAFDDPTLMGQFTTEASQKWALGQIAATKEHFGTRVMADASSRSFIKMQADVQNTILAATNHVANDPTALEFERSQIKPLVDGMIANSANLSPEDQEKARSHLTQVYNEKLDETALAKLSSTQPALARKMAEGGAFPSVMGEKREQLLRSGDLMARQRANEDRAAQNYARIDKDRADIANYFRQGGVVEPSTGQFIPKPGYLQEMQQHVGQPGGPSAAAFETALRYANKPDDTHSGDGMFHKYMMGALDGTYSRTEILDATGLPGQLSKADAGFILRESNSMSAEDKRLVTQTFNEAKTQLATKDAITGVDPLGQHYLTRFTAWMQPKIAAARQNGTLHQILDPSSPDYILKDKSWDIFRGPLDKAVESALAPTLNMAAAAASATQGGSFEDRIIRLGEHGHPGDVNAKSGAFGEGQLMPATAADPGYGIKPYDANVPGDNRRFSGEYARAMLREFDGGDTRTTESLAAAAYNAGPGKVKEWIDKIGDPRRNEISLEDFISRIPAAETRAYVGRVVGSGLPTSSTDRAKAILFGR